MRIHNLVGVLSFATAALGSTHLEDAFQYDTETCSPEQIEAIDAAFRHTWLLVNRCESATAFFVGLNPLSGPSFETWLQQDSNKWFGSNADWTEHPLLDNAVKAWGVQHLGTRRGQDNKRPPMKFNAQDETDMPDYFKIAAVRYTYDRLNNYIQDRMSPVAMVDFASWSEKAPVACGPTGFSKVTIAAVLDSNAASVCMLSLGPLAR